MKETVDRVMSLESKFNIKTRRTQRERTIPGYIHSVGSNSNDHSQRSEKEASPERYSQFGGHFGQRKLSDRSLCKTSIASPLSTQCS